LLDEIIPVYKFGVGPRNEGHVPKFLPPSVHPGFSQVARSRVGGIAVTPQRIHTLPELEQPRRPPFAKTDLPAKVLSARADGATSSADARA